jgi:hypothetical protein
VAFFKTGVVDVADVGQSKNQITKNKKVITSRAAVLIAGKARRIPRPENLFPTIIYIYTKYIIKPVGIFPAFLRLSAESVRAQGGRYGFGDLSAPSAPLAILFHYNK